MDKLGAMQLFVASAESRSFSRTAEQLGMTPSGVAKATRLLETQLGVRLFERTTRRMALTEAGALYLELARDVIARIREGEEEIVQLQQSLQGALRISGPLSFGRPFLNAVCAAFMEKNPGIYLEVDLSDEYVDLMDGRYDLALRLGHSDSPGLIAQDIGESRAVLCASPDYLARAGIPQHPQQLVDFDWLVYRHAALGEGWCLEKGGQRHLIRHRGRLNSDNLELLLEACLAGQGIMPCPYWSMLPYLSEGLLQVVLGDYRFDQRDLGSRLLAVYPSTRRATRKINAFIEHLRDYLAAHGSGLA
ncbi:LysR family transcriptional regulator [Pseudomonas sp. PA15(2017)]|uniref:LysR family transcriptional regulator n=1 Tax=Pseudomonas sp. PA15(2017) TaxID=1932111 RepID=UPI000961F5D6|nr:LysR family transcriptional regulator [Pseudomonas sp. PA15(2017)]OLU28682.1 LysR family transcriptional regulator [Pseudomonas sp. PA15(2017)]